MDKLPHNYFSFFLYHFSKKRIFFRNNPSFLGRFSKVFHKLRNPTTIKEIKNKYLFGDTRFYRPFQVNYLKFATVEKFTKKTPTTVRFAKAKRFRLERRFYNDYVYRDSQIFEFYKYSCLNQSILILVKAL